MIHKASFYRLYVVSNVFPKYWPWWWLHHSAAQPTGYCIYRLREAIHPSFNIVQMAFDHNDSRVAQLVEHHAGLQAFLHHNMEVQAQIMSGWTLFWDRMKWKTTDRLNNITPKNQVPVSEHIVWVEMGWSKGHLADRKKPVLKRWIQYMRLQLGTNIWDEL